MEFKLNPKAQENILKMARLKLLDACDSLVSYIRTVKLSKGRRGQGDVLGAGDPPYTLTGNLRNRVAQREKEGDPNTRQVGVFGDGKEANPHAAMVGRVQELGVSITSSKLMTIPRSEEAVNFMMRPGAIARDFPKKLTMIPSRGRSGIFFLVEQKRGGKKNAARSIIHFVLAHNVNIPPHPWLSPSLTEHGPAMMKIMGS